MDEFEKLKKKRSLYRRSATKLEKRVNEALNGEEEPDIVVLKKLLAELKEVQSNLKRFDQEILDFVLEKDDEECENEMDDATAYREKIVGAVVAVEEKMDGIMETESIASKRSSERRDSVESSLSAKPETSSQDLGRKVRVKLPELELSKFSGKIHEWVEFWDSFCSAVHHNGDLADVDKLKYLWGFLEGPAKSVISGIPMTDTSYETAVNLLKGCYANPTVIQRAHINQLLNLAPVFNEKNVPRLRSFHDQIETHFRGLEALGVDKITYSSIIVPVLMEKLPEIIRLGMVRDAGKTHLEWNLEEMLESLKKEIEIRECQVPLMKNPFYAGTSVEGRRPNRYQDGGGKSGIGTASALFAGKEEKRKCAYCLQEHPHEDCLTVTTVEDRKNILRKYSKCFICLNGGHRALQCRSNRKCGRCKGKHHISICINAQPRPEFKDAEPKHNNATQLNASAASWVGSTGSGERVALQTALAKVNEKEECKVRVLFDTGSHKSFVTAEAVCKLGLRPVRKENLGIRAFGQKEAESKERDVVEFSLSPLRGGKSTIISCFVVDDITCIVNVHPEQVKKQYKHLSSLWFADVSRQEERLTVQVLIGSDFIWQFQEGESIRGGPNEPVAVKTTLGWTLSGPLKGKGLTNSEPINVNFIPSVAEKVPANCDILKCEVNKLWDLDTLGIKPQNEVHEKLIDNISFTGSRYSVGLPWKAGHDNLPSNYANSLARLKSQVKKLERNPDILCKYNDIISEQLESGIIEKVPELHVAEKVHYLPHTAVVRENAETTKVRIVYDASCKYRKMGIALNDCLHVGPPLTPLIFDILMRFREAKVAIVGDIEKAFLNIEVDPADRDCLRFLWFDNVSAKNPEIVAYRFNRVVFGVNSSPFILNAVLQHHIKTYNDVDPQFVQQVTQSFFVDDFVASAKGVKEAFYLYQKVKERMLAGGFKLRKWKSNDPSLYDKICEEENREESEEKVLKLPEETYAKETLGPPTENPGTKTKVLGICWDTKDDTLEIDLQKVEQKTATERATKRSILSSLATIYDPLGIVSPVAVNAKVMFQEMCQKNLGWDDPIPEDKELQWKAWVNDLSQVKYISVPRCLFTEDMILSCQLHGFGDASQRAYCAVIYAVYTTPSGSHTQLLCSKSRVAPLKQLSIPRLELLSARILSVLMSNVVNAFSQQVSIDEVRFWLDSKTALYWIKNQGEWKQWVQFRVAEILKVSRKGQWGHVSGTSNPADLGSRGVQASQLAKAQLWWEGPVWLKGGKSEWPTSLRLEDSPDVAIERRKVVVLSVASMEDQKLSNVMDIKRFSNLGKLLRVTAWVKRFISNLKAKREGLEINQDNLNVENVKDAETDWIKDAQKQLKAEDKFKKSQESLGIFEKNGVLVCTGRLEHSDLEVEAKFPIILPKENKFTELVIKECHARVHHGGVRATLTELRSRFWVVKGRQCIKKILKSCFICRKYEGKPFSPSPGAALPEFRVTQAEPFNRVGVDFAGPFLVKEKEGKMSKAYLALFSCCVTRALHLELVPDMNTSTFVNCFRRFCARRGTPQIVVSDNAKTFKATSKLFQTLMKDSKFQEILLSKRIDWRFNLERSPWWGGFFERMVRSVKRCARKVLGNAKLTFDELSTVLSEIECTLNSRPLMYVYDEPEEQILTPSHLLTGHRISDLPDNVEFQSKIDTVEHCNDNNDKLTNRFLYLTRKLTNFWNRWRKEYIVGLREVHKIKNREPTTIAKGDLVLIYEDNVKRGLWKVGMVEELITGADGYVRGAKVRKPGKGKPEILNRPVQKLFPLECAGMKRVRSEDDEKQSKEKIVNQGVRSQSQQRPTRAAAKDARCKTQIMLDSL